MHEEVSRRPNSNFSPRQPPVLAPTECQGHLDVLVPSRKIGNLPNAQTATPFIYLFYRGGTEYFSRCFELKLTISLP